MRCLDRSAMQSFVDGELDSLSADTIRAHLSACPDCRDAVDAVRRRAQTVRRSLDEAWPVVAAPPLAHAVPLINDSRQRVHHAASGAGISNLILLLAAAGLLIAGMGIVIWQQRLIMGELRATWQPPVTTVTIAAGDTILQREIVLDLSRCQPVEDTTVYVLLRRNDHAVHCWADRLAAVADHHRPHRRTGDRAGRHRSAGRAAGRAPGCRRERHRQGEADHHQPGSGVAADPPCGNHDSVGSKGAGRVGTFGHHPDGCENHRRPD